MDLLTAGLICLCLGLLVYFFVMRFTSWPVLNYFKDRGIVTPPCSKILGHFMESFKYGMWDVQTVYHAQFKDQKVYGWYDYQTPVVVLRDLDIVKDVMVKHFGSFTDRRKALDFDPPFDESLIVLKGENWKRVRNAVSPTFSTGRLKKMYPHVERKIASFLRVINEKQERNEEIELKDFMGRLTMDLIASTGFGLEIKSVEEPENEFSRQAKTLIQPNLGVFFLSRFTPQLGKLLKKIGYTVIPQEPMDFFVKLIDSAFEVRKDSGHAGKMNDFIDLALNSQRDVAEAGGDDGKLRGMTRDEVFGQAILFIFAGNDTVSTVLSFTLFLLAIHPECQRRVQEELDQKMGDDETMPSHETAPTLTYLDQCVNEAMRMFPPAPMLDRVCTEDITCQGVKFSKDVVVLIPCYAFHMDPAIWDEPQQFNPDRFDPNLKDSRHPFAYLPFGHGPRNCVAMRLGQLEVKMTLAAVLKQFNVFPCEKTVYPVKLHKAKPLAVDGLWVRLERRKATK